MPVLDLAGDDYPPRVLAGRGVALVFQKPSARTRSSSELAVFQLGGHPVTIRATKWASTQARAPRMSPDALPSTTAPRRPFLDHAVLERMASVVDIPVINLLSDRAHPLQAIATS